MIEGDVRSVNFAEFEGRLDLVSGGPPCQPFSLGGRHRAFDDARDMFPEAVRVVRETRPKAFILRMSKDSRGRGLRIISHMYNCSLNIPN